MRRITSIPRVFAALAAMVALPTAFAATPQALLDAHSAQAGATPRPARGRQVFNAKQGREWTCASCRGAQPVAGSTGKVLMWDAPCARLRWAAGDLLRPFPADG